MEQSCVAIPEELEAVLGDWLRHVEGGELDVDGAVLLSHVQQVRVRVGTERGPPKLGIDNMMYHVPGFE